jgi:hypothetical protein
VSEVRSTLENHRVVHAIAEIPAHGLWFVDAELDAEVKLAGRIVFKLSDLTLRGTILSGGAGIGRSRYRIVAGAGGWGLPLKKENYQNDAGVKLATVLGDAARLAGETIEAIDQKLTVGPGWNRIEDEPASRVLERTVPGAWYVDEDGTTRLGERAASTLPAGVTRVTPIDYRLRKVELASDSIAKILPGVMIDDLRAVDVKHEMKDGGLRTTVWGSSRRTEALRKLQAQLDPLRDFRGPHEYRVVTQNNNRLDLQPVRVSTGMPSIRNCFVRPGVAGAKSNVMLGSRVVVWFLDADPSRAFVTAMEDADGEGFVPTKTTIEVDDELALGGADGPAVARKGDGVNCGYLVYASPASSTPAGYFPGTVAGKTAADALVTSLGGTAFRVDLNTGGAADTATGGVINQGAGKATAV